MVDGWTVATPFHQKLYGFVALAKSQVVVRAQTQSREGLHYASQGFLQESHLKESPSLRALTTHHPFLFPLAFKKLTKLFHQGTCKLHEHEAHLTAVSLVTSAMGWAFRQWVTKEGMMTMPPSKAPPWNMLSA